MYSDVDQHRFNADLDKNSTIHLDADSDHNLDPTPSLTHFGKSFFLYFYLCQFK
jgi:hypothetical protein